MLLDLRAVGYALRDGALAVLELHPLAVELAADALDLVRVRLGLVGRDLEDTEVEERDREQRVLPVRRQELERAVLLAVFAVVPLDDEVLVPVVPGLGRDL